MVEGIMTARVAVIADFEKLQPLMQANCEKMQYEWSKYEVAARHILENPDYGFFILAETQEDQVVGFISFTFEWSDWRNGACFWI